MPDDRIEKAAIAVFATQTNWADLNPGAEQIQALWDGQMDAIRDSFRRLAKAALDSQEDQPADLDWKNAEPKDLDRRTVKAVTKDGTIVQGRTVAVHGSFDQLTVEGIGIRAAVRPAMAETVGGDGGTRRRRYGLGRRRHFRQSNLRPAGRRILRRGGSVGHVRHRLRHHRRGHTQRHGRMRATIPDWESRWEENRRGGQDYRRIG